MTKATLRWALISLSLLLVGPAVAWVVGGLRDVDGGRAVTLLVNGSLPRGLLSGLVVFAAATLVGAVGARFLALGLGVTCAGIVLAWAAWSMGTAEDVLRRANSPADLPRLALEGFLVTAAAAALCAFLTKVATHRDAHLAPRNTKGIPGLIYPTDTEADARLTLAIAVPAAIAAAAAVTWLLAVTNARGQTLAAALFGAVAAAAAAQVIAASRRCLITPAVPALAVAAVALAGPLIANAVQGSRIIDLTFSDHLLPIARPISLDWAAGTLLGIPLGLSWAGSMLEKKLVEPA